jgi:hypothetical protein
VVAEVIDTSKFVYHITASRKFSAGPYSPMYLTTVGKGQPNPTQADPLLPPLQLL